MRKSSEKLLNLLRARDPLIYTLTYEENEFIEDLCSVIRSLDPDNEEEAKISFTIPKKIYYYTRPTGLYEINVNNPSGFSPARVDTTIKNIYQVFEKIRLCQCAEQKEARRSFMTERLRGDKVSSDIEENEPAIFIFKDLHLLFNDKDLIRILRDVKENYNTMKYCPIIVTSPTMELPAELEKIFTLLEYNLMDKEEMREYLTPILKKTVSQEKLEDVVSACVGLTKREVIRAISHSFALNKQRGLTKPEISISDIHEEKLQIIKKSNALDFIVPQHNLDDLGGCDNFKQWVRKIKESMDPAAREFGIPAPKGAMLVGVPGTSKTVSAEILASYLNVPLLSLDMAKVMGSYVGQSERQVAFALNIAKAVAPCVLLIDEAEKVLGGLSSSNSSDAGTLSRVVGQLLNFLQTDDTGVITMMTSNDVSQLPPELTRTGRLDAQWMFDLPNLYERSEILNIYLKKNNLEMDENTLTYAAIDTENFTGAEIKSMIKDAMINSFYRQKEEDVQIFSRVLTKSDIETAINNTVTIWKSSSEKIAAFQEYAKNRYLNASKTHDEMEKSTHSKLMKTNSMMVPKTVKKTLKISDAKDFLQ